MAVLDACLFVRKKQRDPPKQRIIGFYHWRRDVGLQQATKPLRPDDKVKNIAPEHLVMIEKDEIIVKHCGARPLLAACGYSLHSIFDATMGCRN